MSKLDEMRRMTAGNVDDSMGVGRTIVHGHHALATPSTPARWQGVVKSKAALEIPVSKIGADPDQPREEFDETALAQLAESLRDRGQIQPIMVRWVEDRQEYVIVAGERRWRAANRAELSTMTCIVLDKPVSPGELLALQLIENLLREDLKPIEQARAYRALMARNGWSVSQVARELAIDHSNVSRALALLALPTEIQHQVEQGALSPSVAYEVSKLDDPDDQAEVARRVLSERLTRAEAIDTVRQTARSSRFQGKGARTKPRRMTERIFRTEGGTKITLENRKGLDLALVVDALREVLERAEADLRADQAKG